jgi:hypothetical protein
MSEFRTYHQAEREPAAEMRPVVDPAAWTPDELGDVDGWSYHLTDGDTAEIMDGIAAVRKKGTPLVAIERNDFPLDGLAGTLEEVRRELLDGRGVVLIRGFPIDRLSREEQAIGYLGLGSYLGERIPQNKQAHVLGHVKDLGGTKHDANTRGYLTNEEMWFHSDSTDFVGLLCLQGAASGGESRVASSVTVYNRMLSECPELAQSLIFDFYYTRHGEHNPGENPWYRQPVFAFSDGYFSACGYSEYIQKAQGLPGVPPLTAEQKAAVPVYRRIVDDCAIDMPFRPGDIQFLNNHVMVHGRRDYEDWPEAGRKRHLLRLWLNDAVGRPIPEYRRQGRRGRGVQIAGAQPSAPLDVETMAA